MRKTKLASLLLVTTFATVLTSCDDDIVNLPGDKNDPIVDVSNDSNNEVTNNTKEDFYNKLSGQDKNLTQLNMLLDSFAGEELTGDFAISDDELKEKYQKTMLDDVKGDSYATDSIFDEYRYALNLVSQGYAIKTSDGKTDLASLKAATQGDDLIVTSESKFEDVFKLDYSDYINRQLIPTIKRQYLTAKYIYENNYSSIGTTSAREISFAKIVDRTDRPGEAKKLVDAFTRDYIVNENATPEQASLANLTNLWKGNDLTDEQIQWLSNNNIHTLSDKISEEVDKIKTNNEYLTDTSLESQYTGSYTYSVEWGEELAKRSLAKEEIYFNDTYLSASAPSSLPSTISDRTFSSNYSENEEGVYKKEVVDNSLVFAHKNGDQTTYSRYVKPDGLPANSTNTVATYVKSENAYYIVEIHSIVSNSRIAKNSSDSDEVKKAKRELAMSTAYIMASQDSYKKTAITHYLTQHNISYSDPDFYEYIETNYPDAIDED